MNQKVPRTFVKIKNMQAIDEVTILLSAVNVKECESHPFLAAMGVA